MKKKIVLYTRWNKHNLECACSFFNPLCEKWRECEELEVALDPYQDIEECMRQRKYKRDNGRLKQMGG